MHLFKLSIVFLLCLTQSLFAQTPVNDCGTLTTSGRYILGSNILATKSPCIIINGTNIELIGSAFAITDSTNGNGVGVQVEGSRNYIHDFNIVNFGVGVHIKQAINTTIFNVGISGTITGNITGILGTGCDVVQIEGIGNSFNITSTSGSATALEVNSCKAFYVYNFNMVVQSQTASKAIHITDSSDGFFSGFVMAEYCNPTGFEIARSKNIRFFSGINQAVGCVGDTANVTGFAISATSDVLISTMASTSVSSKLATVGVSAVSSKYIGVISSSIVVQSGVSAATGDVVVIDAKDSIGVTVEQSSLVGFAPSNQQSTGLYLEGITQVGIHMSQIRGVTTGAYISKVSDFYANAVDTTATTTFNFEGDAGKCSNAALNADPSNSCYPPSNDSCCDTTCSRQSATCQVPTVTTILGLPFDSAGAFITILGSGFGDNYYDTVVVFNDTLCLIHERNEDMIVCWITGDIFETTASVTLSSGWSTYKPPAAVEVSCDRDIDCPSNICLKGLCVVRTNDTTVAGQPIIIKIDLGYNNFAVITVPADAFPAGYTVESLSRAVTTIKAVTGNLLVVDFEFYVYDLAYQKVTSFPVSIPFTFYGPNIRAVEGLYVKNTGDFVSVGNSTWTPAGNLTFSVSSAGIFAVMAPLPTVVSVSKASTAGGRITINGTNLGTSGEYMLVHINGPSISLFCPVHVTNSVVAESSIECDLAAGVGQQLTLTVTYYYPASSTTLTSKFSFEAPVISAIYPNRTISTSELPGLTITVVGSNFGPSDANGKPLAPEFNVSLASIGCTNIHFETSHQQFTCQLGAYANSSVFSLSVGDTGASYTQKATYNLDLVVPIYKLLISAPSNVSACSPFAVTVTALDELGQTAIGFSDTISFTSTDTNATLPSDTTLKNGSQLISGFAFNITGTYTITVLSRSSQPATATISVQNSTNGCGAIVVGCDGVVGSRAVYDTCGVCGGNNSCVVTGKVQPHDKGHDHKGAIIGGVIGGFFGLLLVAGLIAYFVRRNRQQQNRANPDFTVTGAAPSNNVKFGIAELGTGYSNHGLNSPNLRGAPNANPAAPVGDATPVSGPSQQ